MTDFKFKKKWMARIFSVLFAFFLWLCVALTSSTDITVNFKVPVNIDAMQDALGNVKLNPILDECITNVKLSGSRKVLSEIDVEKDIEVCADMSKVVVAGEYTLNLHCNLLNNKDLTVVSIYPRTINVKFDKLITKKFALEPDLKNITVPENYIKAAPSLTTAEITVTGPETELSEVDKCKVIFNSDTELRETTTLNGEVKICKSDGTEIVKKNISCSHNNVDITIPVYKIKKLPLSFDYINKPKNLNINKLKFSQSKSTIKVGCDPQQYDNITEIFLGYVNIPELTPENNKITFDLDFSLNKNLFNVNEIKEAYITFDTSNWDEKTFSSKNIKVINKPPKISVKMLNEGLNNIKLVGNKESIAKIKDSDIAVIVDAQEINGKKARIPIAANVIVPGFDDVWAVGTYEVYVKSD